MSVVTVKVFYEKIVGSPEIRRFPLDTNLINKDCFVQVKEKIRNLYQVLTNETFELYWKDSDGDRIAFSSEEEMRDALKYVTDGVFRIYIPEVKTTEKTKPKESTNKPQSTGNANASQQQQQQQSFSSSSSSSQSQSQSSSNDGPVHPGVVCDGCEGPVKGIRFKCCVCPDFDLCSTCEEQGQHSEHDMYKITQPRGNPFQGFMPPHLAQYIHAGAHNAAHAAASAAAASASSMFRPPGPNNNNNNNGNTSSSDGARNKENGQAKHDEYLKNVGANIAAFLDPFGIDVTYDVHHNNGQQQHGHWSGPCGGGNHGQFWRRGGCPAWENMEKRAAKKNSKETDNCEKPFEGGKKDSSADAMETDGTQTTTKKTFDSNTQATGGQDVSREKSGSPGSDEWTFVPDDGSEVHVPNPNTAIPMPPPPSAYTAPSENAPVNSQPQESTPHNANGIYPDLRVQQSLEQMLAMGFTNTDNWLSDLLIENSCDIGQTLDAIKAKATQQLESLRQ